MDNGLNTSKRMNLTDTNTRIKGNKGEDIACKFLQNKGFTIVGRNYLKKWGELDIIAIRDKKIHFIEVKSVTSAYSSVSDSHKPEDNVHGLKVRKIRRMIQTYLSEKKIGIDQGFEFHVLSVYMDLQSRKARVKWIKNLIL